MNSAEKKLVKKILARYKSPPHGGAEFTRDENLILDRLITLRMINGDAFSDVTAGQDDHKQYLQNLGYPLSQIGEQESKKSGYLHFRESIGITILRDALTIIAFLVSLYLALSKLFLN